MNVEMIANVIGLLAMLGVLFFGCRFIEISIFEYFSIQNLCKRHNWEFTFVIKPSGKVQFFIESEDLMAFDEFDNLNNVRKYLDYSFKEFEDRGYICRPTLKNLFRILRLKLKGRD